MPWDRGARSVKYVHIVLQACLLLMFKIYFIRSYESRHWDQTAVLLGRFHARTKPTMVEWCHSECHLDQFAKASGLKVGAIQEVHVMVCQWIPETVGHSESRLPWLDTRTKSKDRVAGKPSSDWLAELCQAKNLDVEIKLGMMSDKKAGRFYLSMDQCSHQKICQGFYPLSLRKAPTKLDRKRERLVVVFWAPPLQTNCCRTL